MWRKKSVIWASEAWEINWIRFPTTDGMVQLPRGSTRARKVAEQQISVNFSSRARDEVKFSANSRIFLVLWVSVPFNFQLFFNFSNLKKKTSVARSRGHIPLNSENLPRATKNGLAGQYFGHPWSRIRLGKFLNEPYSWNFQHFFRFFVVNSHPHRIKQWKQKIHGPLQSRGSLFYLISIFRNIYAYKNIFNKFINIFAYLWCEIV